MNRCVSLGLSALALAALAACGDSSTSPTQLSGQVVKGPVGGASVCVYALTGGVRAATPLVPCASTDANGNYTFSSISGYAGDVVVEASGGTYVDEASGTSKSLGSALSTVMSVNGGSLTAVVTPLTTIAVNQAGSNPSAASVSAAATALASQAGLSGVNILTTLPTFASGGRTATNAYAAVLGGLSQYMQTQGTSLQQTIANWTAANQAAYQSALNAYVASAGLSGPVVPGALSFSVTVASGGSSAGGASVPSVTGSGGLVSSSSLSVSGASAAFAPLSGVGLSAGGVQSITFSGIAGTLTQSLTVVQDSKGIEVVYHEGSISNPLSAGAQWRFSCAGAACTGKVSVDTAGKTVTLSSVALTPDGRDAGSATGNLSASGSGTYQ